MDGPQVDIHPPAPWRTGLIYDETRGVRRWISPSLRDWKIEPGNAPHHSTWKADDWNDLHIRCTGTRIQTWLNDARVVDFNGEGILNDEAHRVHGVGMKGHIALQLHTGDELYIQFKDIIIRPLS
jgi:hypothetical protein